ncbi:MAG: SdpI family protein [Chloroflexi bacterium]|nr:SdpI family protein [Chloroflexota bacterium]
MFGQPFFIPSALIALFSLPLIFGWIPRQSIYGVRTPKTLSSDEIWYPANRFAGVVLLVSSFIYLAAAWTIPNTTTVTNIGFALWLIHLGAFALPLIVSLLLIRSYVQTL